MSNKYRVMLIGRRRFSMDIEAESKSEAERKFLAFISEGGWDTVGVSTQVEELKKGGAK